MGQLSDARCRGKRRGHSAAWLGTWDLRAVRAWSRVKLGYRHIDTAEMYDNEKEVGEGLRQARGCLFVTHKKVRISSAT